MKKYHYSLMTLQDTADEDTIFVPNCTAKEAIQVWRWLSGNLKDFPEYQESSLTVVGILEDAWISPAEYRDAYCPPNMACIVRTVQSKP